MPSDLVLINGKILTQNPAQPTAEAIAVEEGKIAFVGTDVAVKRFVGKKTKVIDLKGRAVVPGFIDTHIHLADYAQVLTWLDLTDVESIKQMQALLGARVKKTPKGKWIVGRGWDEAGFAEKRLPTHEDLDAVSPDNPVIFYHKCGQICVANGKALQTAGLTKQTVASDEGGLDKNTKTGAFTGVLRGDATSLVWKFVPSMTDEELLEAVGLAFEKIAGSGITSVCWIVFSTKELAIIEKLAVQKRLPLSVYIIISVDLLDKIAAFPSLNGNAASGVRIGAAMVFADGYLATRTAAMFQPYNDAPDTNGNLLNTQEELNATAEKVHKANLQLIIHAAGDRGVDAALKAMEKTAGQELRNRLEQAAVLNPEIMQRIKNQDGIVSVQPLVINSEFHVYSATDSLGPNRIRYLYPLKTLVESGIKVVGGSDCPMEPLSPLLGIQAVVTRECIPQEQVTPEQALRMYTTDAAFAVFAENIKGTIENGKSADLAVLSHDPRMVAPMQISKVAVHMTIAAGKIVYSNTELSNP